MVINQYDLSNPWHFRPSCTTQKLHNCQNIEVHTATLPRANTRKGWYQGDLLRGIVNWSTGLIGSLGLLDGLDQQFHYQFFFIST